MTKLPTMDDTQDTPPVVIDTADAPQFAVIWLHGLGADGSDFVPMVAELDLPAQPAVRFIFPHAPVRPVSCNGGYPMRAWYDILSLQLDRREIDQASLLASRALIHQLIKDQIAAGIPAEHILIGGFSQGGALAYLSALTFPQRLAGIVALSTYIPSSDLLRSELAAVQQALPIFAAHGSHDEVVAPELGKQALTLLEELGFHPVWHSYPLGHEVSRAEIADLSSWLQTLFTSAGEAI